MLKGIRSTRLNESGSLMLKTLKFGTQAGSGKIPKGLPEGLKSEITTVMELDHWWCALASFIRRHDLDEELVLGICMLTDIPEAVMRAMGLRSAATMGRVKSILEDRFLGSLIADVQLSVVHRLVKSSTESLRQFLQRIEPEITILGMLE